MPLSPDMETRRAFEELYGRQNGCKHFGKAWCMTVHGDEWTLYHYGTRILTADERSGRTDLHGAVSRSDVDKMNGLCRLLYGACRFRMHHGRIVED